MKLVTFQYKNVVSIGHLTEDNKIIDFVNFSNGKLPNSMDLFLEQGEYNSISARKIAAESSIATLRLSQVNLLAPILNVPSLRGGYAFREHVEIGRKFRGMEMIPEYDKFPVFYFANHNTIIGPGPVIVQDEHLPKLDFELECAIVIGKKGKNIKSEHADQYIAGYTILNDWSARHLQSEEMKLNFGPVKGKDFATSIGPYIVTQDELELFRIPGTDGDRYNLKMTAKINGVQVSEDNLQNMYWTFAQIIERASMGTSLYPGDIIGSGTCKTGCLMEHNLKKKTQHIWLKDGDAVELSIDGLGTLKNTIEIDKEKDDE